MSLLPEPRALGSVPEIKIHDMATPLITTGKDTDLEKN
jgi:hypothetical protein